MARTGHEGSRFRARRAAASAALVLALGGVLAVSGLAATSHSGGAPAAAAFRLADSSVACNYADGTVACRADRVDAVVVLEADGSSHEDEDRAVAWDDSTPVLLPGESWWHGDVSCRADAREITCSSGPGELHVGAEGAAGASSAVFDAR
jgi:hypothetical protein